MDTCNYSSEGASTCQINLSDNFVSFSDNYVDVSEKKVVSFLSYDMSYDIVFSFDSFVDLGMTIKSKYLFSI